MMNSESFLDSPLTAMQLKVNKELVKLINKNWLQRLNRFIWTDLI